MQPDILKLKKRLQSLANQATLYPVDPDKHSRLIIKAKQDYENALCNTPRAETVKEYALRLIKEKQRSDHSFFTHRSQDLSHALTVKGKCAPTIYNLARSGDLPTHSQAS